MLCGSLQSVTMQPFCVKTRVHPGRNAKKGVSALLAESGTRSESAAASASICSKQVGNLCWGSGEQARANQASKAPPRLLPSALGEDDGPCETSMSNFILLSSRK